MQRVAHRQVVFYFEPTWASAVWLVGDYFPEIADLGSERAAPRTARISRTARRAHRSSPYRYRPTAGTASAGATGTAPRRTSTRSCRPACRRFAQLDPEVLRRGTEQLRRDLETGAWDERHGELRTLTEIDVGYRLLVAGHLS